MFRWDNAHFGRRNQNYHVGLFPINDESSPSRRFFNFGKLDEFPILLFALSCILFGTGLLILGSISWFYFVRQLWFVFFGLLGAVFVSFINPRYILRYAYLLHLGSILLLLLTFAYGDRVMGAQRWINILWFRFQPSECAKITLVLAIARYYHFSNVEKVSFLRTAIVPFCMIFATCALVFRQPDLGSSLVILLIAGVMIFLAGLKVRFFVIAFFIASVSSPLMWHNMHDYQKRRVLTFINPESDVKGAGYNIIQSKITIGSGGWLGRSYEDSGQSTLGFLPETHTDFILSVFAERYGLIGVFAFLSLLFFLIYKIYEVSISSKSPFLAIASIGVAVIFFVHIFVNAGMVSGILPVVGSPAMFLSYGGTFALVTCFGLGVVFNAYLNKDVAIATSVVTYMFK